jgi:hypothetical protein
VTGVALEPGSTKASKAAEPAGEIHVCEECGKEYKTERGLEQHTAREHA